MFESLSDRLSGIFDKLTRRGALTDSDVSEAMREVRLERIRRLRKPSDPDAESGGR